MRRGQRSHSFDGLALARVGQVTSQRPLAKSCQTCHLLDDELSTRLRQAQRQLGPAHGHLARRHGADLFDDGGRIEDLVGIVPWKLCLHHGQTLRHGTHRTVARQLMRRAVRQHGGLERIFSGVEVPEVEVANQVPRVDCGACAERPGAMRCAKPLPVSAHERTLGRTVAAVPGEPVLGDPLELLGEPPLDNLLDREGTVESAEQPRLRAWVDECAGVGLSLFRGQRFGRHAQRYRVAVKEAQVDVAAAALHTVDSTAGEHRHRAVVHLHGPVERAVHRRVRRFCPGRELRTRERSVEPVPEVRFQNARILRVPG